MASDDWLSKFQSQGFAVIENFLSDTEIERMKSSCADIIDKFDPNTHRCVFSASTGKNQPKDRDEYFLTSGDKVRCFYEKHAVDDEGNLLVEKHMAINKIGHALHVLEPAFASVTFSDKVKDVVKRLQFVDPVVMQSMYILKPPKIGGEVGAHQDASYLYCDPLRLIGLWFALEDTTTENGCLQYIPNSHRDGLHCGYRYLRKTEGDETAMGYEGQLPSYDPELFIPVPVRKGSAVVFDGLAVHRSDMNTSEKSRHAYTIHIYDGASKWSEQNWLQPTENGNFVHLLDAKCR